MDLSCVKVMKKKKKTSDWINKSVRPSHYREDSWKIPNWKNAAKQNSSSSTEPCSYAGKTGASNHLELFIQVHDLDSYLWILVHVAPSEWFLSSLINSPLFFRQKGNTSLMSCLTRSHTPIICLVCYFLSLYILLLWHLSYSIINVRLLCRMLVH